jgi:hypothetical protein
MSSSRHFVRAAFVALALSATAALSGCTGIRPVYGQPGTGVERYAFSYGAPASRLDQVVYNDLRLRLGPHSTAPTAVKVTITTTNGARVMTKTNPARPSTAYEMIVTANVKVVAADGKVLFSGQRRASADYMVVSQVLADTAAAQDAAERAARSVAETVRLTIISVLERP